MLKIILLGVRNAFNHRLAAGLAGLLLLQYALGLTDLALLAPLTMQILHLFGADLLWITLVILVARLSVRPLGCTAATCGEPAQDFSFRIAASEQLNFGMDG